MNTVKDGLKGWKTYIMGVGLILTGIAEEIEKNKEDLFNLIVACLRNQQILMGLSVMGLRAGIAKSGEKKGK